MPTMDYYSSVGEGKVVKPTDCHFLWHQIDRMSGRNLGFAGHRQACFKLRK